MTLSPTPSPALDRDDRPEGRLGRFEPVLVVLILLSFLAVNFATGTRFPAPWMDEAFFADPAINYATGQGFVSQVQFCGDATLHSFFACNMPLYPYLLGNWFRVFGFSLLSARSLNYLLFSLAAWALWLAARRRKILLTAPSRLLFLGLLLLGYGDGFIFRSARNDCLGVLLFSLVLLASALRSAALRLGTIGLLGLLLPFAGFQFAGYATVLGAVLLAFFPGNAGREIAALAAGIALGIGGVLLLFAAHGVLANFFASLNYSSLSRIRRLDKDPSLALLFAACLVAALGQIGSRRFRLRSPLGFGIVCAVVVFAATLALREFPLYYSWMAYIPLALGFAGEVSRSGRWPAGAARAISVFCLCSACVLGLPVQLASAAYYWNGRDAQQAAALARKEITGRDWVYADPTGYFAARRATPHVVNVFALSPSERGKVTVLMLPPKAFAAHVAAIGGQWRDTGAGIADRGRDLVHSKSFAILLQRRIDFEIYRRVGSKSPEGKH